MSEHFIKQCIHGTVAAQCRCAFSPKRVIPVECPETCLFRDPPSGQGWERDSSGNLIEMIPPDMIDRMAKGQG